MLLRPDKVSVMGRLGPRSPGLGCHGLTGNDRPGWSPGLTGRAGTGELGLPADDSVSHAMSFSDIGSQFFRPRYPIQSLIELECRPCVLIGAGSRNGSLG